MASSSNGLQPQLPRLNGKNYYHWSIQMKVLYESQDLWSVVESGVNEPADPTALTEQQQTNLRESRKRDKKALFFIYQAVDDVIFERISTSETSKDAWDMLYRTYRGEDKVKIVKLQTLRCEFDNLRMKDAESVEDYYNRVILLLNQLRLNGEIIEDKRVVEKILRSLTRKFEYVVVAIEESKDLSTFSLENLLGTLQSHELRIKQFDAPPIESAFQLLSTNQYNPTDKQKFFNNEKSDQSTTQTKGRGHGRPFSQIQCNFCQKFGHTFKFCRKRIAEEGKNSSLMHKEDDNDDEIMFMMFSKQENMSSDLWYMDSGCSNHMTGNRDLFVTLDDSFNKDVRTGDDKILNVKGNGDVRLRTRSGDKKIQNVYFVPGLKYNLLSVGQLILRGYDIHFKHGSCEIKDMNNRTLGTVHMTSNKMFPLRFQEDNLLSFKVTNLDASLLWHKRYGHMNFGSLTYMSKQEMVKGLPNIDKVDLVCEGCILGKQSRESFPKDNAWRAKEPLGLIHTDVCGPMRTDSIGGSRFFLTFIDDFSRKIWVYFLKAKSEVFEYFKTFRTFVEKQSGKSIKALRSDCGGEYTANHFQEYLKQNGIHHQYTTRYTPQQNGVAERKNRTVMEMARCMLKNKGLADLFWAEAVACAVYLLNRAPTRSLSGITPQEAWHGFKPGVGHLKIFGCLAYSHIPDQKRGKLDNKSEKVIFIGYSENSKAYKLYNPISNKVIISRDVVFDEEKGWDESLGKTSKDGPIIDEDASTRYDDEQENENSPLTTPIGNHTTPNTQETLSSSSSSDVPRKYRSMADLMQNTQRLDFEEVVDFVLFADADPISFDEAYQQDVWKKAMDEEINSILKNETWELVELPKDHKPIGVKWVYKTKLNERGEIDKHKARLVVKGYKQRFGIDYKEVFAPVIRLETIRLVLALSAQEGWRVHQMDVKSAFLNGTLNDEVYIDQPVGYVKKGQERKVCRLKKALYGLKQAPRAWYSRIDNYFSQNGFKKCTQEHTLYTKGQEGNFLIVCLYVDDLVFTGNSDKMIEAFKTSMKMEFEMTDMGLLHYFLGIEVKQKKDAICISQQKYAREILNRFNMSDSCSSPTPMEFGLKLTKDSSDEAVDSSLYRSLVGSLMYLTATRPDILFAVSLISRFMEFPKKCHWEAGKRIMRFLKGTLDHGIIYTKVQNPSLKGYSDSDFGGSQDDSKSTAGYMFNLGSGAVSWQSKKQNVVALSSAEAEYMALSFAGCQAIWLRGVLDNLNYSRKTATTILCDNKSTIALTKNPVFHGKSKHIRIKFHFIRELVNNDEVEISFCISKEQVADIFTKALQVGTFNLLKKKLGMDRV